MANQLRNKSVRRGPDPIERAGTVEQTATHFRLPDEVWWTYFWLAEQRSTPENPVSARAMRDEGITWFLNDVRHVSYPHYMLPLRPNVPDRKFYLDSTIWERAKQTAERDEVPLNRLLMTALYRYLEHIGTRAGAADIVRLKAMKEANPGVSWRVVRKKGTRYRSKAERALAAKHKKTGARAKK